MKKQYVLSEEEYQDLVPKSELEKLQKIIDRATEKCVGRAFKKKDCIKGEYRRYCKHYDFPKWNCKYLHMCNSEMKEIERAPRELDHMIE